MTQDHYMEEFAKRFADYFGEEFEIKKTKPRDSLQTYSIEFRCLVVDVVTYEKALQLDERIDEEGFREQFSACQAIFELLNDIEELERKREQSKDACRLFNGIVAAIKAAK